MFFFPNLLNYFSTIYMGRRQYMSNTPLEMQSGFLEPQILTTAGESLYWGKTRTAYTVNS